MRGRTPAQTTMVSLVNAENAVPKDHPLRAIKKLTDEALRGMDAEFDRLYAELGRPSVPPERLLKAMLLMAFFSVRSERQLCEQLRYNLLFRWFLDMNLDEPEFAPTVFSKNRERLMKADVAQVFLGHTVSAARDAGLVSSDHFSVDGTLMEAYASMKSFKRKDGTSPPPDDDDKGNPTVNFRGEQRSNQTHGSVTDPDARLIRKAHGQEAKLAYYGHALMENSNGLVVGGCATLATGTAEREAAEELVDRLHPGKRRITLGADRAYDTQEFTSALRCMNVTPHVAQHNTRRRSSVDRRTTRHRGYALSQRARKRVEEVFGWLKTVGGLRKVRHRGVRKVDFGFVLGLAAYNLVRLPKLMAIA